MGAIGYVDGKVIDLTETAIELEDRGYQFGDGVYEVTRVYDGRCFALQGHIARLFRSLRELRIPVVHTQEELTKLHEMMIEESGIQNGNIYLQVTRGVAPRGHAFPERMVPRIVMTIRPGAPMAATIPEEGVRLMTMQDIRWLRCDIKSLNLLPNVLAKQAAKERGCYEALLVRDGIVTEGSSSNFFVVKDGLVWTHTANNLILEGIIRTLVVHRICPAENIMVIERPFDQEFMRKADEAFLTGTTTEVMPVAKIDDWQVGDGNPGPITSRLAAAYRELVRQAAQSEE